MYIEINDDDVGTGAPNPAGSELGLGITQLLLTRWLWPDIFVENYKKISF